MDNTFPSAQRTTVQDLIQRIRDDGVRTGQDEAERLVREARAEADRILAGARKSAEEMRSRALNEIETHRVASLEALKQGARDTVLDLQGQIARSFESFVKRLVTTATADVDFIRALVLVLAGRCADEFIANEDIRIQVAEVFFTDEKTGGDAARGLIAALASDTLREGVELAPGTAMNGGARVQLGGDQVEIDLSDTAIARMISERLLPRFRAILEGAE